MLLHSPFQAINMKPPVSWEVIYIMSFYKAGTSRLQKTSVKCLSALRTGKTRNTGILYSVFPAAAAAKSLQSCPTLCDPMDCSPPGSSVHGIFQARVLSSLLDFKSIRNRKHICWFQPIYSGDKCSLMIGPFPHELFHHN